MTTRAHETSVYATNLAELSKTNCLNIQLEGHNIVLFKYGDMVYAIDNRCPHMGFPLSKGTVRDGILTCHWHHARFDLASGGTFDQWADDVRAFPVEIRDAAVWVDLTAPKDPRKAQTERLEVGLERNLSLVLAKSAIALLRGDGSPATPFLVGLHFGTRYRRVGWGAGLTIHTCMMKLILHLDSADRPRALYHGLSAVANDSDGSAPRFIVRALPTHTTDIPTLKRWYRQFIEVRDAEGAERCVVSAVEAGASPAQMADMLLAALTDHRYITLGHPLDFTNKAFEALDIVGWEHAAQVLTSVVAQTANGDRMEEANEWRYPIDLVAILDETFAHLPNAVAEGRAQRGTWDAHEWLIAVLLDDDPHAIAAALLGALRAGCRERELASSVSYAAALRVARFHTSNEFGDWDTALHSFTFANAVEHGLARVGKTQGDDGYIPLLRGVFDAAMSVYLDRFLNVPAARLPQTENNAASAAQMLEDFEALLNRQQQVNEAGALVATYLANGGAPEGIIARLGKLLLREDRNFHTIQMVEAAIEQYQLLRGTPYADHVLIAAARYLAAHAPTMRSQGQTFNIAQRLAQGGVLFEDE